MGEPLAGWLQHKDGNELKSKGVRQKG